jgi:hypothetical protein
MNEISTRLGRLIRQNQCLDFHAIVQAVGGRSRRSLFRDLRSLGYLTSFTHAGRYYTLWDIPSFDEHGLWFHKGIGFSRAGTLKSTLIEVIGGSEAGHTHPELKALMHVRVQNTLFALVQENRVAREQIEKLYVYVSAQGERAREQVARRREWLACEKRGAVPVFDVPVMSTMEVLMEVIRAGRVVIGPLEVVERLHGRGIRVSVSEAEEVFLHYGLKKTPC